LAVRKALSLIVLMMLLLTSPILAAERRYIPLDQASEPAEVSAQVVSGGFDDVIIQIEVPGFGIDETQTERGYFTRMEIGGCGRTIDIGKADLPVLRRAVEIPQGAVPEIEILEQTFAAYDLADLGYSRSVYPVQEPVEKLPGASEAAEFAYSGDFYSSSARYPDYDVRVAETGQMRGHRFASIEIAPLHYVPSEGRIDVLQRLVIRIKNTGGDIGLTQATIDRYYSPRFEREAAAALLNYLEPGVKAVPPLPVGYLIITDPDYADEIQPLADWKTTKGYLATVTATSAIPGGATTTAIKNYIKDAWQNWTVPPSFVLLVGDVADIPNWTGIGTDNPPTDLYYATMTDPDYIPDLGIGRFSVAEEAEVTYLVDKTIEYEKRLFSTTAWLKKAVFMASEDNYSVTEGTHNYVISTYLDPAGFYSQKLYSHTYHATTQQVRDAFNDGRVLGIYSGHGATTYWADGPVFYQSDVEGLTNAGKYPFVESYACYTGRYTESECFAETWIRQEGTAGIVFWGSSVTSYWDEDDVLEKQVFKAQFADGFTWVSGMLDQGKWGLYQYYSGGGSTQRYFEMYNIFGDPSIDIWTDTPADMVVTHDGVHAVGATTYAVQVDDAKGPVADALICLDMPGNVYETAYTDANGEAVVVLDPPPMTVGDMALTITRHNFNPAFENVQVIVPAIVTIDPDTILVETPTAVTVTVLDTLYQPIPEVVVTIEGWGLDPALRDTTGAGGQAVITVNPPFGEDLSVVGREIGLAYDAFSGVIHVAGASALPSPGVDAEVPDVGLSDALTPHYTGTLTGYSGHAGLEMFAVGGGVDTSTSTGEDSVFLDVVPVSTGDMTVVLAYPGYEIYTEIVPIIEVYGTVSGTVSDAVSDVPLVGVPVKVFTAGADTSTASPVFEVTSGVGGTYASPESIAVGNYDFYAREFGYLNYFATVMVYYGSNTHDIEMDPAPSGVVSGTVTEDSTGAPLSATIDIYRSDDMSLYATAYSDSNMGGAYTTPGLPYFDYLFRVRATHHMTHSQYLTVDEATETADFVLVPTQGNILVVDDYDGSKSYAAKTGAKGEVIAFNGVPNFGDSGTKSADQIAQDLADIGYDVVSETAAETDPGTWPNYDIVVWSSGDDTQPVSVSAYRASLNQYVAAGGKLIIEGGEIGYDAASYPGYPNFADSTLHIIDWEHDSSGNLSVAMPAHPVATTPNALPATLSMAYVNYGDQDALVPAAGNSIVYQWSTYSGQGGVLVYDDTPDPQSAQVIFYSFDYTAVTDADGRRDLLENSVVHLLTEEGPPTGMMSGYVYLFGELDHSGVVIDNGAGRADTTDACGYWMIDALHNGTYNVTASKAGYADSTRVVQIAGGGAVTNVNFTLYKVLEYFDSPAAAIPDNDPSGKRFYIDVPVDATVHSLDCYVDITHPYRGDLIVELKSPGGVTVRLHNRTDLGLDDIITWYDSETEPDGPGSMDDFVGVSTMGKWELWVSDNASGDVGTLNTWGLRFSFPPDVAGVDTRGIPPAHFLAQNSPNPFGAQTSIRFGLPRAENIDLSVFNIEGRKVATLAGGLFEPGIYTLAWDGRDSAGRKVASGIYFCRLEAGAFEGTTKMLLMK
jgi:subtilisin-like proprotein convertase family protein